MNDVVIRPIEKIKKKCLCCGKEMELEIYEERDFCDKCFPIVCREVFNKANDGMTVEEVKERIRRIIVKLAKEEYNDIYQRLKKENPCIFLCSV